jgi:hypothetical protein
MSVDFLNFFQLNENFTASELFSSYNNKIAEIDSLNISSIDKEFYKKNINLMYSQAKNSLDNRTNNVNLAIDNAFLHINHFLSNINAFKNNWLLPNISDNIYSQSNDNIYSQSNDNIYSQSKQSSYKEVLNADNSITVHEETIINNNGIINKTIKSYKKYKDGRIENV